MTTPAATMSSGSDAPLMGVDTSSVTTQMAKVGASKLARRPSTNPAPAIALAAARVTPSTKARTRGSRMER
jgi:hypothetical protein